MNQEFYHEHNKLSPLGSSGRRRGLLVNFTGTALPPILIVPKVARASQLRGYNKYGPAPADTL